MSVQVLVVDDEKNLVEPLRGYLELPSRHLAGRHPHSRADRGGRSNLQPLSVRAGRFGTVFAATALVVWHLHLAFHASPVNFPIPSTPVSQIPAKLSHVGYRKSKEEK